MQKQRHNHIMFLPDTRLRHCAEIRQCRIHTGDEAVHLAQNYFQLVG